MPQHNQFRGYNSVGSHSHTQHSYFIKTSFMGKLKRLLCAISTFSLLLAIMIPGNLQAQSSKIITGKIVDKQDGMPISGAAVTVKGTRKGTIADNNGVFKLNVESNATLVASFVGFKPTEVALTGDNVTIEMIRDTRTMNEVVVTALGVT